MNRLEQHFANTSHKTIIPYVTAGYPAIAATVPLLHSLVKNGADILELGVPFSDPAADGAAVQLAHETALQNGVTFQKTLDLVAEFRRENQKTPLVLMMYLNSLERFGVEKATAAMKTAGVDGVILVDCPIEALPDYENSLKNSDLAPILLVAPTTESHRKTKISESARGFIYLVSLRGVTGSQIGDLDELKNHVQELKALKNTPVCIGFGINDPESAHRLASIADGVIIGSALIKTIAANPENPHAAGDFIAAVRQKLDS